MKNYIFKSSILVTIFFCLFLGKPVYVQSQSISTDKNAVIYSRLRVSTTTITDASDAAKAAISISYFDGLGRPLQTIGYKQSPSLKDIVLEDTKYDAYNRVIQKNLPSPVASGTGGYQSNVVSLGQNFYADTKPFSSVSFYENSPLNREKETIGAGQIWQTNNKKSQVFYENAGTDVRLYRMDASKNVIMQGTYPANSLFKKRMIDEQGNTSIIYSDKAGRIIQKQQQDNTGYITTYYVYDDFDRLVAIIQPQGYELGQSFYINDTNWNNWLFYYEYDKKGRMRLKKVAGINYDDAEYMVYDNFDRLILSQNGLQRVSKNWTFYKYDAFNREVIRGEFSDANNWTLAQFESDAINNANGLAESRNTTAPLYYTLNQTYPSGVNESQIKVVSYYDNYTNWMPSDMAFDGVNAYHSLYNTTAGLKTGGKVRNTETNTWMSSVIYYDNKNRVIQSFSNNLYGQTDRTDLQYNFANEVLTSRTVMKDATATARTQIEQYSYDHVGRKLVYKTAINATPTSNTATYAYDEIGRLIQKKIKPGTYAIGNTKLLKAKAFLGGAFPAGNTLMNDDIRHLNLLPLTEPYTAMAGKFVHTGGGGGEQTTTQVLTANANTPNAIVDWVFLELRDAGNVANIMKTRSALLQRDGDIVDVDGISAVNFGVLPASSYYVAIKHRNHLGIMTASPISFTGLPTTVDFSTMAQSQIYNNAGYDGAEMKFAANPYTLWSGDANVDGKVKYSGSGNDASIISYTVTSYPANTTKATNYDLAFLYHSSDVNMNGKVKFAGSGSDASAVLGSVLVYPLNTSQGYNYDLMLEQLPSPSQVVASSTPATTDALQTIDYSYNIRGGLQCLNCSSNQVANGNNQNDLFSMKLDFHEDGRYYDGNISKQTWLNATSTASRSYLYTYDKASRITNAAYAGGTYVSENYGMSITGYDKNGNIQGLNRTGAWAITNGVPSGFNTVDALSYFYNGNRLSRVEDGISGNLDVGDFKNNNANSTDYIYWQDGSLKTDLNKGISQIDYDAFLQKPKQINFSDGRRINFYYDTQGQKLKQTTSVGDETHYATKAVYQRKNAVTLLYQISQAEGRELPFGSTFVQEYEYRDLVGNLRLSFKDATIGNPAIRNAPTIVQGVEYDPWGLELNGIGYESTPSPSKFKFQGKEEIKETGWYDFGARMYDPQIGGRFLTIDPLAEKMPSYSPFSFSFNNPIRFIDPDGRAPFDITLLGANNSSVTVKTDLVDLKINASGLGVDFGGNYTLSGNDVLQAAVDIGGVFDPTGALDVFGAKMSYDKGDYWGAAASGFGAAVPYIGDLAKSGKIFNGIRKIENAIEAEKLGLEVGDKLASSSRGARREAMRDAGIPTSQQPLSQSKNASGREYTYEVPKNGGGKQSKSVQQQTLDSSHPGQNHWEAGKVRKDADGNVKMNNYGRPRLDNEKSKVNY